MEESKHEEDKYEVDDDKDQQLNDPVDEDHPKLEVDLEELPDLPELPDDIEEIIMPKVEPIENTAIVEPIIKDEELKDEIQEDPKSEPEILSPRNQELLHIEEAPPIDEQLDLQMMEEPSDEKLSGFGDDLMMEDDDDPFGH